MLEACSTSMEEVSNQCKLACWFHLIMLVFLSNECNLVGINIGDTYIMGLLSCLTSHWYAVFCFQFYHY